MRTVYNFIKGTLLLLILAILSGSLMAATAYPLLLVWRYVFA